jgi:hypothetical protein
MRIMRTAAMMILLVATGVRAAWGQRDTLGYVAVIRGTWYMDLGAGPLRPLGPNSVVMGLASIGAAHGYARTDEIEVVTLEGNRFSRLCSAPGACDQALQLPPTPTAAGPGTRVASWIRSSVRELFDHPKHWVVFGTRSGTVVEGVVSIGPDVVDWSPLIADATPQPALLRLSPVEVTDTEVTYGARIRVSVDDDLHSPSAGLRPGLYRVQVGDSHVGAWVLLSDPATFEADSTAFRALRNVTSRWEGVTDDSIQRSLLRAALNELAKERAP